MRIISRVEAEQWSSNAFGMLTLEVMGAIAKPLWAPQSNLGDASYFADWALKQFPGEYMFGSAKWSMNDIIGMQLVRLLGGSDNLTFNWNYSAEQLTRAVLIAVAIAQGDNKTVLVAQWSLEEWQRESVD